MSRLKIKITAKAREDIKEVRDYIAKDNISAANKTIEGLKKCISTLADFPHLGKLRPDISCDNETLFFPVMKKYIILYAIVGTDLIILRVSGHYQNIYNLL